MKGTVARASGDKGYGFILGEDRSDYFFHRDDFIGNFSAMAYDVTTGRKVKVEFTSVPSPKGPRASNVIMVTGPDSSTA